MAHSCANSMDGGGGEQNALAETQLVIRIKVRSFGMNDDRDGDGGARQLAGVGVLDAGQALQHTAIAHDDELPRLAITCAAGPARNFENVVHDVIGQGVGSELTRSAQIAQQGDLFSAGLALGVS